jgi:hypothetical protein
MDFEENCPPTSIFRILTNDLNKRKISVRWVPHCLTAEQKQKRLDIATLLKQRFDAEGKAAPVTDRESP